jgi:hypothetical protein
MEEIKTFVENIVLKYIKLNLEDVVICLNKIEFVLSTVNSMISISILDDFTCDILVVNIENEDILLNETRLFNNQIDLYKMLDSKLKLIANEF